jgi:hypothetical protein
VLQEQNAHVAGLTPWGKEVKRRLLDRLLARTPPCTQADIIRHLQSEGYEMEKNHFTYLLKGVGVGKRTAEIGIINDLLGIEIASN